RGGPPSSPAVANEQHGRACPTRPRRLRSSSSPWPGRAVVLAGHRQRASGTPTVSDGFTRSPSQPLRGATDGATGARVIGGFSRLWRLERHAHQGAASPAGEGGCGLLSGVARVRVPPGAPPPRSGKIRESIRHPYADGQTAARGPTARGPEVGVSGGRWVPSRSERGTSVTPPGGAGRRLSGRAPVRVRPGAPPPLLA